MVCPKNWTWTSIFRIAYRHSSCYFDIIGNFLLKKKLFFFIILNINIHRKKDQDVKLGRIVGSRVILKSFDDPITC